MNRTISAALIGAVSVATLAAGLGTATAATPAAPPAPERSLILNAFGDAKGTYGESKPYINTLTNKVDRTSESAYCEAVVEGDLHGQPVTVVVTGTGGGNSGPCTQEMLGWYAPSGIKEMIWSGIGGATPAVGGLYDKAGQRKADPTPVMIGDVCVGTMSWNYDLHFSNVNDWAEGKTPANQYTPNGGWWEMVNAEGKSQAPGFDNVQQFIVADPALANEVLNAAKTATMPTANKSAKAKIARFYPNKADQRPAKVWGYQQCGGEVSGDNFWHGATEDRLARGYMADLMNTAGVRKSPATAGNIVAFSAMEAVPWMSAVERWNKHNGTSIPMVVIRAASNYDQMPLQADGTPVLGKNGKPLTAMQDILLGFDSDSGDYAAAAAAAPVLNMFAQRAGHQPR